MGFETPCQEFTYVRTYSRWLEEARRRETWLETVERYIDFVQRVPGIPKKVISKLRERISLLDVVPSMRLLWSAGPAAERDSTCGYNCSYQSVDSVESFSECLFILMSGVGYGFSVQQEYVNKLPIVPAFTSQGAGEHVVKDSKEGWADSLKALMYALYNGRDLSMNYSEVRPQGERLKTMGGRASGPAPLLTLHNFVRETFAKAQGRKLLTLDCHDLETQIAEIVVVGGVRRSSEISLSDLDDVSMAEAKCYPFPPRRSMANNSAVYEHKPTAARFLTEWANLANSGTGERGIFNLQAARSMAPSRRKGHLIMGTNPCQPGWATVLTPEGVRTFDDISVGSVIWTGENWTRVSVKVPTGVKPVYRYSTTAGEFIGTENHRVFQDGRRVEAQDAVSIDYCQGPRSQVSDLFPQDIMDGLVLGDGGYHAQSHDKIVLYVGEDDQDYHNSEIGGLIIGESSVKSGVTYAVESRLTRKDLVCTYARTMPDFLYYGDSIRVRGFLRGLFSANGGVNGQGKRIELRQTSQTLIRQVQVLLSSIGIPSYVTTDRAKKVEFSNGEYECKESYKLNITSGRFEFMRLVGFIQTRKNDAFDWMSRACPRKTSYEVVSRDYLGDFPVYDITVDDADHCYWTGGCLVSNCGEINLRNRGFCNLTEVVVRPWDDVDDLLDKVETATWAGAIQSTFTNFPYLSRQWTRNCNEERLLGVSLTGQFDNITLIGDPTVLRALKSKALKVAKHASQKLGIPFSAAVTCGKPSGTASLLVDSAPGGHPRHSEYTLRRFRISATDPLFHMMRSQGVKFVPEVGQRREDWDSADKSRCSIYEAGKKWSDDKVRTWVCAFPMKAPKGAVLRSQVSAMDQLNHYLKVQTNWCEHNQSMTVYVKPDEWFSVGEFVYKHWDKVNGLSFLPYDGGHYELAPFEEISKERYEKEVAEFPKLDYSKLSEFEQCESNSRGPWACTGDKCELAS